MFSDVIQFKISFTNIFTDSVKEGDILDNTEPKTIISRKLHQMGIRIKEAKIYEKQRAAEVGRWADCSALKYNFLPVAMIQGAGHFPNSLTQR